MKTRSGTPDDEDNYFKRLLRSLEHRIISLQRQLENKQRIIEQLIAWPKSIHQVVNKAPMGINDKNENKNEKKLPKQGYETKKNSELREMAQKLDGKKPNGKLQQQRCRSG